MASSNQINIEMRSFLEEDLGHSGEMESESKDANNSFLAFIEKRHLERIEGTKTFTQTWRMKERMKTVSVALVLCLNVGVDPPDVVKTTPCARLECWIDPSTMSAQKALETVGSYLQKQYERWQPRARYKQSLDPTVDEVKKLCMSLRRNAKEERVLFHYNGHGVPRPTINGEIWVFNKSYTQYIPLSVYDLQTWMGSPSIYVYDCSNAGIILESFKQFSVQREQEAELSNVNSRDSPMRQTSQNNKNCIQLAACSSSELLPMNPELPADLFTACLTTPIKIALRWYVLQNTHKLVPSITLEDVDKIPGQLNDRRTMLGEMNWIFTAITDTIAWNTLPRELFQKLFRQDLLVASLFRNFLLAERIMRSYNCTPTSSPKLPPTYQHPMWQAWDLALDLSLCQLPKIMKEGGQFQHSKFFAEQLTAFQVWLSYGAESRHPPEQLPIVLQVLLSQVHRLRALDLLGRFLDLGPWAVSLALSVGIFPYVLKLLQSSARELRPLLVFIWAKILAVDSSCQADLVKDNGHKYFLSVLADPYMPAEHRTMAAFVLAMIVNSYPNGQEVALQGNLIAICLEQLSDKSALLRQWLALCLGKVWTNFDAARWCGVRDTAHEKMYILLTDPVPEVRAAAVYALGTFIANSTERSDHANNIDHSVGLTLINSTYDGSPLVRKELVVSLSGLVHQFENQFTSMAYRFLEDERRTDAERTFLPAGLTSDTTMNQPALLSPTSSMKRSSSKSSLKGIYGSPSSHTVSPLMNYSSGSSSYDSPNSGENLPVFERMKRVSSSSCIASLGSSTGYGNIYANVWKHLLQLSMDPYPEIADLAKALINTIKLKADAAAAATINGTPPRDIPGILTRSTESPARANKESGPSAQYTTQYTRSRKLFDKGPTQAAIEENPKEHPPDEIDTPSLSIRDPQVSTEFFQWCCKYFAQPIMRPSEKRDPESETHQTREWRLLCSLNVKDDARDEQLRAGFSRLDDQVFINRNCAIPTVIKFHPYESHLAVADREGVSIWEWEQGTRLNYFYNKNPKHTRITSMEYINCSDTPYLLTGTDDGAVRLWKTYYSETGESPEIVTAWQGLSDMLPSTRGSGLVTDWEQQTGILLASGDVRIIRVWDVNKELKIKDLPTGADSCVTSLTHDTFGQSLVVAGCGDGSVRLYDRRLSQSECRVMTLREHSGWVVKVHLQQGIDGKIISGSVGGDIRFWDPRFTESVKTISTSQGLTSLEVHEYADVLACGSVNQYISVFNQSGDSLSNIKYHEGFMGQRIGPITCMAFHPHRVKLAAGSTDAFVSVYSTPDKKR
ncbi:unnamed protein product [Owenia fusiformis]|uniref:Uncharacterized protein n=1 Tax=Owenia fusiformis TaxID=6347 RepID=A0A8J1UPV4_OWEFU|nr:unnamed protein product [Owenia fusiformis]